MLKLAIEEKTLARYIDNLASYQQKLPDANLLATAMAFFQRFYLHYTMFQVHPEKIVHIQNACLFLATKVHEIGFGTDEFCKHLRLDHVKADLLNHELIIVTELNH